MEPQQEALWYCAFQRWYRCFFFPSPPSLSNCIDDPRLKVRMASQRQDKDTYTHAEVTFETLVAARS
jgi:hypothetical protein